MPTDGHDSRQQMSAQIADSEEMLPNAPTRKARVRHRSGAPGWNRTSDTRFRKPVLYPLSYEGIVPICRDFSLQRLGKGYHELLIGC